MTDQLFTPRSYPSTLEAERDQLRARVAKLEAALIRIADLTQHNMGMTARDETCVYNQARAALQEGGG